MADYKTENTFALFKNGKKNKDTHPDWTGTFTDDKGAEYFMDAWVKTPKNGGDKFLSGRLKKKEKQPGPPPGGKGVEPHAGMDDDIPF